MKRPLYLAALAGTLLAAPAPAQAGPPSVSVSGEGTVSAAPDLAVIDGGGA